MIDSSAWIRMFAIVALFAASLSNITLGTAQEASPGASPAADADAQIESTPCPFDATQKGFPKSLKEGDNLACGALPVPMDHNDPSSPKLNLLVTVIASASATPAPEPVVFLAGGPGQGGSFALSQFSEDLPDPIASYMPLLEDHNVVLIDQRGTGFSEPSLACPSEVATAQGTPVATPASGDIVDQMVAPFLECDNALTDAGVDLDAFSTEQSAADLETLRVALDVDQLDLLGTSYGTWLALEYARAYPDGLHSMVLNSPVPAESNLFAGQLVGFDGALSQIFEGCAANAKCDEAFPELDSQFSEAVAKLTEQPLAVPIEDPATGKKVEFPLDASTFVNIVYLSTFTGPTVPLVAPLIASVNAGIPDLVAQLAASGGVMTGITFGLYYSILCQDEAPFTSMEEDLTIAEDAGVRPELLEYGQVVQIAVLYDVCADWTIPESDAVANEPVQSDAPTLIMTGTFDPITPPSNGDELLPNLPNATVANSPIAGHDPASTSGTCGFGIVVDFFDDPEAVVDASCLDDLKMDFFPKAFEATPEASPAASPES